MPYVLSIIRCALCIVLCCIALYILCLKYCALYIVPYNQALIAMHLLHCVVYCCVLYDVFYIMALIHCTLCVVLRMPALWVALKDTSKARWSEDQPNCHKPFLCFTGICRSTIPISCTTITMFQLTSRKLMIEDGLGQRMIKQED